MDRSPFGLSHSLLNELLPNDVTGKVAMFRELHAQLVPMLARCRPRPSNGDYPYKPFYLLASQMPCLTGKSTLDTFLTIFRGVPTSMAELQAEEDASTVEEDPELKHARQRLMVYMH